MKNSEKILFGIALAACIGGCAAYALLALPADSKSSAPKTVPRGAEAVAWKDKGAASAESSAPVWSAPESDLAEGWNYDLFTSPEINWDSKQKKYFAKELPPPPEEVFGLTLKSLKNPEFRLAISSYSAGTKPVPEQVAPGRYAAVLTITDRSGKKPQARILNFGTLPLAIADETDASGTRSVTFLPEAPVTISGTNAKLKSFRISQRTTDTGAFSESLSAEIIDESGRNPREFVIGTSPVSDKNRTEAVFSDGFKEWLYAETRIPGNRQIIREIFTRDAADQPFVFVGNGTEIRSGSDIFRIKGLDISAQRARIEKQSSELDKKTKAPKTTERVLSPE